uniref:Heat shock protein 70 n=1 Tax=Panagrolaimus davidi TaxID=227884 RepID=A0A914P3D6_9BILA
MAVQKFNVPDKTQIQGFVSPEEVAADLLKLIKKKAEEIQGTSLKNCVITVPAAFNDSQNAATIKAAEMAGWKDILLLPEPIAAAFAYFHDIDEFDTNQDGIISITQEEFEKMTQSLLNKVENTLIAALYKPKLYANQIDKVLLVGGGSRMPMIKDLLKEKFPKAEHCCHEHPDEVVAIGAAHYACTLQKPGDSGKGENCTIM